MAITTTPAPIFTAADFAASLQAIRSNVAEVAREVGINRQYLSEFRAGSRNLQPDLLQRLREYFEAKGLEFDAPGQDDEPAPQAAPTLSDLDNREDMARALLCVRHFALSPALDCEQITAALERMDANDQKIRTLLVKPVQTGFFNPWGEETQNDLQEVYGLMAENHILFRHLQGRALIVLDGLDATPPTSEAKDVAGIVAGLLAGSLGGMAGVLTPKAAPAGEAAEAEATPPRAGLLIEGEAA
jgi:transcriptional regulator with XRE-family HTH domain